MIWVVICLILVLIVFDFLYDMYKDLDEFFEDIKKKDEKK